MQKARAAFQVGAMTPKQRKFQRPEIWLQKMKLSLQFKKCLVVKNNTKVAKLGAGGNKHERAASGLSFTPG